MLKFGQIIGFDSTDIAPSDRVREHNVRIPDCDRDYQPTHGVWIND